MKKYIITYGLILGIITTIKLLFFKYINHPSNFIVGLLDLTLLSSTIFYGMYKYKKSVKGILTLKQALFITLGISFIGGLFTFLWFALKYNIIEPDFVDGVVKQKKEKLLQENFDITYEEVEQLTRHAHLYASSYAKSAEITSSNLIFGPFIGLITYAFLHKRQKL